MDKISGIEGRVSGGRSWIGAFLLALTAAAAGAQTWNYELLHAFGIQSAEGVAPLPALLQASDGQFYGTTTSGGSAGGGAIFILTNEWRLSALRGLESAPECYIDRDKPYSALVQAIDGSLYGTTCRRGSGVAEGTAFRIDLAGNFTQLHVFNGIPEGLHPVAALLQDADGQFYGTTGGGTADTKVCPLGACGAVFKMDSLGTVTVLHNFSDTGDGAYPQAALIKGSDGFFYGTTAGGLGVPGCPLTVSGCATAFKMDVSGHVTKLHDFGGDYPNAPLVQAADGDFYGLTRLGGASGFGSVFRMDSLGVVTPLHSFDVTANPAGPLIQTASGDFYGTTAGGSNAGTVFKINSTGGFGTVHVFDVSDGASPSSGLIEGADGNLYGTAGLGGPGGGGVIFRLTHAGFAVNAIEPSSGLAAGGTGAFVLGGGFEAGATLTVGGLGVTDASVSDSTIVQGTIPALTPGTLNDVTVANPASGLGASSGTIPAGYFADFLDVSQADPFHDFIETIFRHAITTGYGDGHYGRDDPITRAQMAVFLLKSEHGVAYLPPPCAGIFTDVPCPSTSGFPFSDWIERIYAEGITAGCLTDPLQYCPDRPVTRAEMAVLLLKTRHGLGYQPPACVGVFGDVPCPSTLDFPFSDWIEQLYADGVTAGCGNDDYCPDSPNTRGEIAVFLVKTFGLR